MDEHRESIAYLCDGTACTGADCYILGGMCRHTFNPEHAKNGPFDPDRFRHIVDTYYLSSAIDRAYRDQDLVADDSYPSVTVEYWIEMEDENEPRD